MKKSLPPVTYCTQPAGAVAASRFFVGAVPQPQRTTSRPHRQRNGHANLSANCLFVYLLAACHPLKHRRMLWCSATQLLWQQLPQSCTVLLTQIPEYPEKCKFFVAASVAQQQKPCLAQSGRWWFVHLYLYLSEI